MRGTRLVIFKPLEVFLDKGNPLKKTTLNPKPSTLNLPRGAIPFAGS